MADPTLQTPVFAETNIVDEDDLVKLYPRTKAANIFLTLQTLFKALTPIDDEELSTGPVYAQLLWGRKAADDQLVEYYLFPHPKARQQKVPRPRNALFIGDAYNIAEDIRQALYEYFENEPDFRQLVASEQNSPFAIMRRFSQDTPHGISYDEEKLATPGYVVVLRDQVALMRDLLDRKLTITPTELPADIPVQAEQATQTQVFGADIFSAIVPGADQLAKMQEAVQEGGDAVPAEYQPEQYPQQQPPYPQYSYTPDSAQTAYDADLGNISRPFNLISQHAGFLTNRVMIDILTIYGIPVDEKTFAALSQIPEFQRLQDQVRQQVIANIYGLSPEDIRGLRSFMAREKLAQKVADQLLLKSPFFSSKLEMVLLQAPPEVMSPAIRQQFIELIKGDPGHLTQTLATKSTNHFEAKVVQNQDGGDETFNDIISLNAINFFDADAQGLQRELDRQLEAHGFREAQLKYNIVINIDKIIRAHRDPYVYLSALSARDLGYFCGSHLKFDDKQIVALKAILTSYALRYRGLVYQATNNQDVFTSYDFVGRGGLEADMAVVLASSAKESDLNPVDRAYFQKISTVATFTAPSDIPSQNALAGQPDPGDENLPLTDQQRKQARAERQEKMLKKMFGGDNIPSIRDAIVTQNMHLLKSLEAYYAIKKEHAIVQQLLLAEEAIARSQMAAIEATLLELDHFAPATVARAIDQAEVLSAPHDGIAAQTGGLRRLIGGRGRTRGQAVSNMANATEQAVAQKMAEAIATKIPQVRAAMMAAQVAGIDLQDEQQRKKLLEMGLATAGAIGTVVLGFVSYLTSNPIVLFTTMLGGAVGSLVGPLGTVYGAGKGFKLGQSIQSAPEKVGDWLDSAKANARNNVNRLFGSGSDPKFVRDGFSVEGSFVQNLVIGSVGGVGIVAAIINTPGTFLLPTLDETGQESKYLTIEKVAEPNGKLEEPTNIKYTVTIKPKPGYTITINDPAPTDEVTISCNTKEDLRTEECPTAAPASESYEQFVNDLAALTGTTLPPGGVSFSYELPFAASDQDFNHASIINRITIHFGAVAEDLSESFDDQLATTSETVCFGECAVTSFGCFEFGEEDFSFGFVGYPESISKAWTESEKTTIQNAFENRMGTSPDYIALLCKRGPITLYRLKESSSGGAHGWAPDPSIIVFYDLVFVEGANDPEYTFAHESGHILDFRNPGLRQSLFTATTTSLYNACYGYPFPLNCNDYERFAEALSLFVVGDHGSLQPEGSQIKGTPEYDWFLTNVFGKELW